MASYSRINWLIAFALIGWFFYLLAPVLTPFVAAAILAYIGNPLTGCLQRLRFSRTVAVVIVFLLTFLFLGLLVFLVAPLMQKQVSALFHALPGTITQIEQVWLPRVIELLDIDSGSDIGLAAFLSRYSNMTETWGTTVFLNLTKSGSALFVMLLNLLLIPILTFYLLRDWGSIIKRLGLLVCGTQRETLFKLARDIDKVLGSFLRGQILVMFALSVIYSFGLALVGLKFAIAIGFVAGLVSFVPYLGFVFGIGLAGLTVVMEPNLLWTLAGIVLTFTIAQMIESSILTPKLIGNRIGLHPVIVIFSIVASGQLFGFFGILLAIPIAAILSVLVRFIYDKYLVEHEPTAIEETPGELVP